jgi:hypothetical protein
MRRDWLETGQALQRMRVCEGPNGLLVPSDATPQKSFGFKGSHNPHPPNSELRTSLKISFKQGSRLR